MRKNYTISGLSLAVMMSLGPAGAFAQTTGGDAQTKTNQAQKNSMDSAQTGACDRLIERLRAMSIDQRPIRLRQARQYRQDNNTQACQKSLQQADQRAQSGNRAGDAASGGQITVQRTAPSVTVSRGQPEITIQQQRPVVTVEIPPPRVTVRMPEPDVNVVNNQQEPNVQFSQQNARPTVNYETAEPQVNVRQSKQSPQVNYERMGQSRQDSDSQTESRRGTQDTATATSQGSYSQSRMSVDDLTDMSLYTEQGELIGDVEEVVRNASGTTRMIIGRGGFLGVGEKQIAVNAEDVFRSGEYLYAKGMTQAAASEMPGWNDEAGDTELDDDDTVNIDMRESRSAQGSMGYNPSEQD